MNINYVSLFLFLLVGANLSTPVYASESGIGDVPPEILREELESGIFHFSALSSVPVDSAVYKETVSDPTLGYRVIALVDKSAPGKSNTAQSIHIFAWRAETQSFEFFDKWNVSTGVELPYYKANKFVSNRVTRAGYYRSELLSAGYVSKSYHEAMPYSVFYDRAYGTAIHATHAGAYKRLGTRASMGCTRLTLEHAKTFYELIQSYEYGSVVQLDWQTGQPEMNFGSPIVLESYRGLVINTEPNNVSSKVQIDPQVYVESPEKLMELIPKLNNEITTGLNLAD